MTSEYLSRGPGRSEVVPAGRAGTDSERKDRPETGREMGASVAGNMQGKSSLVSRRGDVDVAPVSVSDFRSDVQPETEPLVRRLTLSAKERLEELSHDSWVNRGTLVNDRQLETLFVGRRQHANGPVGRAVS